jgi:ABC-type transport system substrate-binding protein
VGYRSPAGLGYDPQRARDELASAGWIDRNGDGLIENEAGATFPIIDLLYTTNTPRYKWISLNLKDQWEPSWACGSSCAPARRSSTRTTSRQGKFMIARGRWYGDYGDPTTFLELCRSTDGNNDRKFSHPAVDGMLDAARHGDRSGGADGGC